MLHRKRSTGQMRPAIAAPTAPDASGGPIASGGADAPTAPNASGGATGRPVVGLTTGHASPPKTSPTEAATRPAKSQDIAINMAVRAARRSRADLKLVTALLQHDPTLVHAHGWQAYTPLHWAARLGKTDIAEHLLSRGAAVDADADGRTPLYMALHWDGSDELIQLLLDSDADTVKLDRHSHRLLEAHLRGGEDHSLLGRAAEGAAAEVREILRADHSTLATSPELQEAVAEAARAGNAETLRVLLDHGVHVRPDLFVGTKRMVLVDHHADAIVDLLVEHGVDPNAWYETRTTKNTALHGCARFDKPAMAAALIRHGADVEARDQTGRTPLFRAVNLNNTEMVKVLLNAGADPQTIDDTGQCVRDAVRKLEIQTLLAAAEA